MDMEDKRERSVDVQYGSANFYYLSDLWIYLVTFISKHREGRLLASQVRPYFKSPCLAITSSINKETE